MAENKMKEVAKLLGVEMGVPFNVKHKEGTKAQYNPYTLKDKGLYDKDNDCCELMLTHLLNGIYEVEKQILNVVEKRYLESMLRPFKDRVEYIKKCEQCMPGKGCKEYIIIAISSNIGYSNHEDVPMPFFDKGTMYKGMEVNKKYTLEELELFQD